MSRAQLALALSGFPQAEDERILVGTSTSDDAGIVRIAPDRALVHTVDLLAPVVDDPYTFGRIAAVNSLSDIYAMGGTPLAAMNVIGFPDNLSPEIMGEILHGGQDEVVKAGAVMLGGHTFQDAEIRYGLALTGEISPDEIYTNSGSKAGDVIVLTKPLGTGTIIQAMMTRGVISEELYRSVAESMVTSNRTASELVREHGAHACTDVTGFGFIGHLWEMADAGNVGVNVWVDRLPVFPNVLDLIRDGVTDAGVQMNKNSFEDKISFDADVAPEYSRLLYASETSGGLLIAVSENKASALVDDLHNCGLEAAAVVGEITTENPSKIRVYR